MGFLEDTVETLPVLLNGTVIAVELFAIVLVLSLPLGLPIAFGENSKIGIIRWLCRAYVFVFRGTPLLLQLFFFYYFFPIALHVQMSAFPTAVLTFYSKLCRLLCRNLSRGYQQHRCRPIRSQPVLGTFQVAYHCGHCYSTNDEGSVAAGIQ